jgi:quinol monooxygenase YgiN
MILEHALLQVAPGRESAFREAMAEALPLIRSHPGCRGAQVQQQVEDPSVFLLLVQWVSVAAHLEDFRTSPLFATWRALTHPFYVTPPTVTHFADPVAYEG